MKRYCFALDLKDSLQLIEEYEAYHKKVWPEILNSIRSSGIEQMEIYRVHTRLFMIMETRDSFSFEDKASADQINPIVQNWESLMWKYQQALPFANPGEKWVRLEKIFDLNS
jgi:L-rhamnose mutarotase